MTAPRFKIVTTTDGSKPSRIGIDNSSSQGAVATFEAIGHSALGELDAMLREFMGRVDDFFYERSSKATSDQERKRYFDAMREFRSQRDELQAYFNNQMRRSIDELARHSAFASSQDEDITRVEISGSEDKIAIDTLVSKARLEFGNDLYAVNERFKALLGMASLRGDDNPFDPGSICENFHAASALLKIDIAIKLIYYKLFEKRLMASLGGIYRGLNHRLAEHGVLPGIDTGGKRGKRTAATAKPAARGNRIVDALTRLQKSVDIDRSPNRVDAGKFRDSIRRQVDELCRQNREFLSSRDTKSIEAVSMLFDFFFEDAALPSAIRVLIGRLQVPVLKVALLEPDFLTRKQHPARRLLDAVSRASLGCSDSHRDTRLLIGQARQVVDFVVAGYDEDAAVFDTACSEFERYVAGESKKRKRAETASRKHEQDRERQLDSARKAASALIGRLVGGRDLDPGVVKFLRTTWTSVLVKTYLSLGESSNHWRNLKRISTTLVWTLIPRHTESERDKIIRTIPALLRALSKGMSLIKTDMQVQNHVFAVLASEHARVVKQTSRNIVTRVDDITVWPEDEAEKALAMTGNIDDDQSAVTCVDPDRIDSDIDAITLIDSIGTNEVIKNLNQFTAGVKNGLIRIDEEIVLSGDDDIEFELDAGDRDRYLELASGLRTGSWVEFIRPDASRQVLRLSWKCDATGTMVFVNGNGQRVKNLTINDLAAELRSNRARCFEGSTAIDRAFFQIETKLRQ